MAVKLNELAPPRPATCYENITPLTNAGFSPELSWIAKSVVWILFSTVVVIPWSSALALQSPLLLTGPSGPVFYTVH